MTSFETLWKNHPTVTGEGPLLDTRQYPNQCAVKLYAALQRSGVNVRSFPGQLSWQKENPKYAIRAQEMADWLSSPANPIQSKVEKYSGKEAFEKIGGRTGIVFFQNYWGTGLQGDHIDLWNGSRLTDWFTWVRIHVRIGSFGVHSIAPVSDYEKSMAIWFWELP